MKLADIDRYFYLMGDEDGDVGLGCRFCDRGGAPIVYLSSTPYNPYENTDVILVREISDMMLAGARHVAEQHAKKEPR